MNLKHLLLIGIAVLMVVGPMTVVAQNPIASCARNCDPASANGDKIPKRGTEPVKMILYGHFEDILNRAPLNTQPPHKTLETDLNAGFMMPVLDTNFDPVAGHDPNFHFKNNEFIMFSSPGLVEYLDGGQGWRTHQEPGLASDAILNGDKIHLYWYMSSHVLPGQNSYQDPGRQAKVGVMPQVGIYARMETGRFPFGKGAEIIAKSADHSNPGAGTKINLITDPSKAEDVYEFEVEMTLAPSKRIPADHTKNGFIVYINPYQIQNGEASKGTQVAQEEWRIRTGPRFPPRVVLEVVEPMITIQSSLSTFDGKLFVRWSFKSVWGSYDMRDGELLVPGFQGLHFMKGKVDPKSVDHVITKRSVDHDGHFKPVNATWAIDYTNYRMEDGDYEIHVSIPNLQGSYVLEETFAFTVSKGVPQVNAVGGGSQAGGAQGGGGGSVKSAGDSPGFGAVFGTLAALAAVVLVRRRME